MTSHLTFSYLGGQTGDTRHQRVAANQGATSAILAAVRPRDVIRPNRTRNPVRILQQVALSQSLREMAEFMIHEDLLEAITCPICHARGGRNTLYISVCSNGHSVCADCVNSLSHCPICQRGIDLRKNLDARRIYDVAKRLDVSDSCNFVGHGCQFSGTLAALEDHEPTCCYMPVRCPAPRCGYLGAEATFTDHTALCPKFYHLDTSEVIGEREFFRFTVPARCLHDTAPVTVDEQREDSSQRAVRLFALTLRSQLAQRDIYCVLDWSTSHASYFMTLTALDDIHCDTTARVYKSIDDRALVIIAYAGNVARMHILDTKMKTMPPDHEGLKAIFSLSGGSASVCGDQESLFSIEVDLDFGAFQRRRLEELPPVPSSGVIPDIGNQTPPPPYRDGDSASPSVPQYSPISPAPTPPEIDEDLMLLHPPASVQEE